MRVGLLPYEKLMNLEAKWLPEAIVSGKTVAGGPWASYGYK